MLDQLICEGSYEQAFEHLQSMREQLPEAVYLYHMGFLAHRQLRHREAIAYYERGLAVWPQEPNLHYGLALALLTVGDYARRWREFVRCVPARRWGGLTLLLDAGSIFGWYGLVLLPVP